MVFVEFSSCDGLKHHGSASALAWCIGFVGRDSLVCQVGAEGYGIGLGDEGQVRLFKWVQTPSHVQNEEEESSED